MLSAIKVLIRAARWLLTTGVAGSSAFGVSAVAALLGGAYFMGQDLAVWVFDESLGVVVLALEALELPEMKTTQDYVDDLAGMGAQQIDPLGKVTLNIGQTLIYVWRRAGMTDAFTVVAAAVGFKLILKLIPFVRL